MAHAANSATEITWQFIKLTQLTKPTYLKGFRKILRAPGRLYELHKKRLLTTSHPLTKKQNPVSALTFPPQPGTPLARSLSPSGHGPGARHPASVAPTSNGDGGAGTGRPHREAPSPRGPRPARKGHCWAAGARHSRSPQTRPHRGRARPAPHPRGKAAALALRRRGAGSAGRRRGRGGGGVSAPLPRPGRG